MVINGISVMQQIQTAYSYLNTGKRKERFDIILEPLQAVSQLAYLKACPLGTKLSIENNLLFIQIPHWHQGLTRAWNKDKREDILLLFNAVQRFNKIYVAPDPTGRRKSNEDDAYMETYRKLIELVTKMAVNGLDNLTNTYSRVDNTSIVQTLVMYKNILNHPDKFTSLEEVIEGDGRQDSQNIEEVFARIKNCWNEHELAALYNGLSLIDKDPGNAESYICGLNTLFVPLHTRIRKWMSDNIVY
jgi:3D (Asp-Asp-Asp) domain-containing protein